MSALLAHTAIYLHVTPKQYINILNTVIEKLNKKLIFLSYVL